MEKEEAEEVEVEEESAADDEEEAMKICFIFMVSSQFL